MAWRLGAVSLAVLGASAGGNALAQWAPGAYVGGNVGVTRSDFDAPGGTALTSEDDEERGVKLYGGYRFHPNFAVEGGIFDLGRFDYSAAGPAGTATGSTRFRGLNLDLVGIVPFTDRLSGLAL